MIGTSNSSLATFTLPYTTSGMDIFTSGVAADNGGNQISGSVVSSGTTMSLGKDTNQSAFTASGTKSCWGQFWYESA